ncbi:transcriptional regulator [Brachyspira suanatina]|uniref:Transcriptional regulator n=1 Tax=Brachyspira suanatina TaxID=381802 RepID=A0A0G4K9G9_9SPIR|nr:GntR family transcriptional regulator [Brachyspira suanatina]CRF34950.1 transcriptional regulator [Brachyspira suanatina]
MKSTSKYKIIENYILDKINSSYYKNGDCIPTEYELAKQFNVSRLTVRHATDNLVAKGFLVRTRGSGTYIAKSNIISRSIPIKSFTNEMSTLGKKVETKVIIFNIIQKSERISHILKIPEDEEIYYFERLRLADGIPMMYESTYMSVSKFPDLSYEVLLNSKYDYVEKKKNKKIVCCEHTIVPIIIEDENIKKLMGILDNTPVLKIHNITYLEEGDVLDYTELIINTQYYQYNITKTI